MAINDNTRDWVNRSAPDLETIETIARQAYAHLPDHFRRRTAGVSIRVADYPDEDIADSLALETPFDLLGLFEGKGSEGHWTPASPGEEENTITFFRRAILDYWAENDETLGDIIVHILVHELGHHFGLSDDEMARIESQTLL